MITKYGFNIDFEIIKKDIDRLTNQLWKLIPMREEQDNWQYQLDTVLNEIIGLQELFEIDVDFLVLITKLKGLQVSDTDFYFYRKTVFECISLLREVIPNV